MNNNKEAKLIYGDGSYKIIHYGNFVYCAVTGEKILLEDLKYWSVDRQEAYKDAYCAWHRELNLAKIS